MQDILSAAVVAALLIACAIAFAKLQLGRAARDERGTPRELIGAEIAYAEHTFRSARHRLVAKIDRAYRVGGELTLVELKTRAHDLVYMADVVELSVQRVAIEDGLGENVCLEAWVVVQDTHTGRRRPHRVRLLEREEVLQMVRRYRDVVCSAAVVPLPARSRAQCVHCAHFERCSATFRDR
jgi:hypothetical protein